MKPTDEVIPGVLYGTPDHIFSACHWQIVAKNAEKEGHNYTNKKPFNPDDMFLDIVFCLIGGHGVKAEAAWAFYKQFLNKIDPDNFTEEQVYELFTTPTEVFKDAKKQKYRFPRQKAKQIYQASQTIKGMVFDTNDHIKFRNQLMEFNGIGYKIAGWLTRNVLGSDEVAILDVHILNAGKHIDLFPADYKLPKDYLKLEQRFLAFAKALGVKASCLDAVMWDEVRRIGSIILKNPSKRYADVVRDLYEKRGDLV